MSEVLRFVALWVLLLVGFVFFCGLFSIYLIATEHRGRNR